MGLNVRQRQPYPPIRCFFLLTLLSLTSNPVNYFVVCIRTAAIVLALLGLGYGSVQAQEFHWERTLPDSWLSIAFNPLSHGRVLFAGPANTDGIVRSDDGGRSWVRHDSVILATGESDVLPINHVDQIFVVPSDTNIVLAATEDDFYRSTDGGQTWRDVYNYDSASQHDTLGANYFNFGGIDDESIAYNASEDALYYGEPGTGVWRSNDRGADWMQLDTASYQGLIGLFSMDVSQDSPPLLLQSTEINGGSLARSTDLGRTWIPSFRDLSGATDSREFPKIVFSWSAANPATDEHDVAISQRWPTYDSNIIATTHGGLTWRIIQSHSRVWGLDIDQRQSMLSKPGDPAYPLPLHFFTGLFNVDQDTIPDGMVQETTDGGSSWHSIGFPKGVSGDTANPLVTEIWVIKYDTSSRTLAVSTDSGIYIGYPANGSVNPLSPPAQSAITVLQDDNSIRVASPQPMTCVRIFDMLGREIFESASSLTPIEIPTINFPRGVYAIEAVAVGEPLFRKLVEF